MIKDKALNQITNKEIRKKLKRDILIGSKNSLRVGNKGCFGQSAGEKAYRQNKEL